jgi:hypothetical protein
MCGKSSSENSRDGQTGSSTAKNAPTASAALQVRSDADVTRLLEKADGRPRGLTEREVAALVEAANRGVLSAYYALHLHYSMDVYQPREEQFWFDRGVQKGEPNLLVFLANREELEAAGEKDPEKKRKLWLSEKHLLEAALQHSSLLVVRRPATVQQQLREVDALIASSGKKLAQEANESTRLR